MSRYTGRAPAPSCNGALKCGAYCEECQLAMKCEKAAVYELLRTGMVGGQAQVFTRYHEKGITRIRSMCMKKKAN